MGTDISPIDQQHAWQTAFQLRTCPDDVVLRSAIIDENLNRHLAVCAICREKRAMPVEQVNAWQNLFSKFAPLVHQAVNVPRPGQVWVLKKSLSRWGDDGYFYSPPNMLLLEQLGSERTFRAAQIYADRYLMGEGDVWLGDRYGFAQTWNTYIIQQEVLDCWLGNATESQFAEVIQAGALKSPPLEEHSILSFFRKLEVTVGSYVALASKVRVVESVEENLIDVIPGLKMMVSGAKDCVLDIAAGALDLLRGSFKPAMVLRGGTVKPATKLTDEQKKLVLEHCQVVPVDMKIVGDSLTVALKWLRDKPAELQTVRVSLNEVAIADAGCISADINKIVIKHPSISGLMTSHIVSLKLGFTEGVLSLHITAVVV